jgi:hypothetical protein
MTGRLFRFGCALWQSSDLHTRIGMGGRRICGGGPGFECTARRWCLDWEGGRGCVVLFLVVGESGGRVYVVQLEVGRRGRILRRVWNRWTRTGGPV